MKYLIGNSTVSLSQKEFLTQGGQGNIYVKDGIVYKIYIDPNQMIPASKIHDLSVLDLKNIIKPEQVISDPTTRSPVGFTMPFIDDTYILCQLFPKAFLDRNNLSHQQIADLVKNLKDMVDFVHSKQILIVDLNEQNLLVSKNFNQIYAIDVDNWQTKSHPCLAVMENIRDPHSKTFSELTDWYSFAITSFQMFVGLHPFAGKFQGIKGWKERMEKNISVFHKDVMIPASAQPFDVIPQAYRDWYKAVFDEAKRLPPPTSFVATTVVQKFVTDIISNKVLLTPFFNTNESIQSLIDLGFSNIIVGENNYYVGRAVLPRDKDSAPLLFNNDLLSVSIKSGKLSIENKSTCTPVVSNFLCDGLMVTDNRLYIKSSGQVLEVSMFAGGKSLTAVGKVVANVLPQASRLHKGCLIQNLLGAVYVSFFPNSGKSYQVRLSELDNHKIISASYENQVLVVLGFNRSTKEYDKFIFRFDLMFSNHDCRVLNGVDNREVEFIVLDTGIVVHILEDGKVELFKNLLNNSVVKVLEDPVFNDVNLAKNQNNLLLLKDKQIYIAKMQ